MAGSCAAILLFCWGIIPLHNLPVEAYPDVANNYLQVSTQWPWGAAEEVKQQVTVPDRDPDGGYASGKLPYNRLFGTLVSAKPVGR